MNNSLLKTPDQKYCHEWRSDYRLLPLKILTQFTKDGEAGILESVCFLIVALCNGHEAANDPLGDLSRSQEDELARQPDGMNALQLVVQVDVQASRIQRIKLYLDDSLRTGFCVLPGDKVVHVEID